MDKTSDSIKGQINILKNQADAEVEFMKQRIILVDAEKQYIDTAILKVDRDVQDQIDDVNTKIKAVADAYQARIDAGCRTLLYWDFEGQTTIAPIVDTYRCKINNSYIDIKNMHGIRYYNEPHTQDVIDSSVGSFIGTVGTGSTVVTIMSIVGSGVTERMSVGNIITCDQPSAFPGITTIVGFSTGVANLFPVGIGTSGDIQVVDTIIISVPASAEVTAPLSGGGFSQFSVLPPTSTIEIPTIPMESGALTPQTIGIMDSSTLGIGTFLEYNNTGDPPTPQSWNPFLEGLQVNIGGYTTTVRKPVVGAGTTLYNIGSTQAPVLGGGNPAQPGNTIVLTPGDLPPYVALASCPTEEAQLTSALNTLSAAESALTSGLTAINYKLSASNAFRISRNRYTLQIWGIRQTLSELFFEKENLDIAVQYVNNSTIVNIIDT